MDMVNSINSNQNRDANQQPVGTEDIPVPLRQPALDKQGLPDFS